MRKITILFSLIALFCFFQTNFAQNKGEKAIEGGIVTEKAISLPPPEYPKEAENACAGGKVEVEILIGEDGNVISAKAISGDELLQKPAIEAAKEAKFRTHSHFAPVKVQGILVYNFDSKVKCITNGIINKIAVNLPKPDTSNIRHSKIKKSQIVVVQIVVRSDDGIVIFAKAISGHPLLRSVCVQSARRTKFRSNGTLPPVKVKGLLVYKFKPDGTVETDIERDDKDVIGTPIELIKPPPPFCNCRFSSENISVEAKIDARGNVTEAKAANGHPILKNISEKAALESKFLPANIRAKVIIVYEFEAINNFREVKILNVYVKKVELEKPLIVGHAPPNTKPIFTPQPEYPAAAKAVGAKGNVAVDILIDENGNVEEAKAVSGHPLLRSAAEKAAMQTRFKPNLLSGNPVKTKGVLVFIFY